MKVIKHLQQKKKEQLLFTSVNKSLKRFSFSLHLTLTKCNDIEQSVIRKTLPIKSAILNNIEYRKKVLGHQKRRIDINQERFVSSQKDRMTFINIFQFI